MVPSAPTAIGPTGLPPRVAVPALPPFVRGQSAVLHASPPGPSLFGHFYREDSMQQVGRMPPAGKPLGSVQRQGIPHLLPLIHDLQRKAVEASLSSAESRSWQARQTPNPRPKLMVLSISWRRSEMMALVFGDCAGQEPFHVFFIIICRRWARSVVRGSAHGRARLLCAAA